MVVLSAFVSRKARLVFLDVIFPFEFFSVKWFRNQIAIEHLRKFVLLPMPGKSEILNRKQKPICQLTTAELLQRDRETAKKMTKARLGLMP